MLQILLGWIRIRIEKNSSCYFCLYQLSCHCKTLLSPFVRTKLSCHVRCSCYFCLYQLSCHVRLSCHLLSKRNCHVISSCHFVSGLTVVSLSDSRVTFLSGPNCLVMSDGPVTFYQDGLWLRCHVRCSCHFYQDWLRLPCHVRCSCHFLSGLTVTALSCQMLLSLFIRTDCDCDVMSDAPVTFYQDWLWLPCHIRCYCHFYQDWLWLPCHVRCSCHFLSGLTVTALSCQMLMSLFDSWFLL